MTNVMMRQRPMLTELIDWLNEELPFRAMPRLTGDSQPIRIEDYLDDGHYVLRAELPDIDPEKDMDITIQDGMLTVHGERREEKKDEHRSEFRYGAFTRTVRLPDGADDDDVRATYDNGILEVRVALHPEKVAGPKRVPIAR